MDLRSNMIYHLQISENKISFLDSGVTKIIFEAYVIFENDKTDIYRPLRMIYPKETKPLKKLLNRNKPYKITEVGDITDFPEYFI